AFDRSAEFFSDHLGDSVGGVFHEEDRWYAVAFVREAVDLSHLLGCQYLDHLKIFSHKLDVGPRSDRPRVDLLAGETTAVRQKRPHQGVRSSSRGDYAQVANKHLSRSADLFATVLYNAVLPFIL